MGKVCVAWLFANSSKTALKRQGVCNLPSKKRGQGVCNMNKIYYNPELKELARKLRNNSTKDK